MPDFELTPEALTAAMEAYDSKDRHWESIQAAIQAALEATPDWMIEQYDTARRAENE